MTFSSRTASIAPRSCTKRMSRQRLGLSRKLCRSSSMHLLSASSQPIGIAEVDGREGSVEQRARLAVDRHRAGRRIDAVKEVAVLELEVRVAARGLALELELQDGGGLLHARQEHRVAQVLALGAEAFGRDRRNRRSARAARAAPRGCRSPPPAGRCVRSAARCEGRWRRAPPARGRRPSTRHRGCPRRCVRCSAGGWRR